LLVAVVLVATHVLTSNLAHEEAVLHQQLLAVAVVAVLLLSL
jgi:hypothetical protein